jgi:radical SAM superfamily enzyme YgiQ (UPF0313 family)
MRIVLADLRATDGLVSKDTVAGGFGSRQTPLSRTTQVYCFFKRKFHAHPSLQMAYIAAICARRGHEVVWTEDKVLDGDVAIILSSLVDYRRETSWADAARKQGLRVGFVGLAASKLPELFQDHADFIVNGEPEAAIERLAAGESLTAVCQSNAIADLDSLPFPRWDLLQNWRIHHSVIRGRRPFGGGFPFLTSRSCPEFCTYCPHRILASYRARSVNNVADELQQLCEQYPRPYVVFRDPLFTEQRERCLELCDAILSRGLSLRFECETRLDHLDEALLARLHTAGLSMITFGVEAISSETLRKVARRPTPETHQRAIIAACARMRILTSAYYVLGFLQDTWDSVAATIDYSIVLGSSFAQFKLLTPYPATPLWKQMQPLICEDDWQKFDGYTPTFKHPNLSAAELKFLLGAAYARFYSRPSWLANYWRVQKRPVLDWVTRMDTKAFAAHSRKEIKAMSRTVTC